jgi:thioredoxin-related protein
MLGVAAGNDNKQIDVYKKQFKVSFLVVPDKSLEVFKGLGVPGTPYIILTTKEGKVLMNHIGVIEDLDQMLKEIREILKQQ